MPLKSFTHFMPNVTINMYMYLHESTVITNNIRIKMNHYETKKHQMC